MVAGLLLLTALVSPVAASGPTRLTLKNGTVYQLREPPRISGRRIVFQTVDGKVFSIAESEVATIGSAPPPPTATPKYSSQDSRALGAIARQQRARKGKAAEVAPKPPSARKRPPSVRRRPRTPTPRPG